MNFISKINRQNFGRIFRLCNSSAPILQTSTKRAASTESASAAFTHIKIERKGANGAVALVTLASTTNKTNTLGSKMIADLTAAFEQLQADRKVAAIVITGNNTVFSAGAEISEMSGATVSDVISPHNPDFIAKIDPVHNVKLPLIAAVNGICLGGGCELAMAADIIYAGQKARFGQPEVRLGVIPGWGGTQRLVRQVGKSKAMEMILTGDVYTAAEMERFGLVSKVLPPNDVVPEAIKLGERIAQHSKLAIRYSKIAVNKAYELPLSQGIQQERQLFYTLFASHDKQEGMKAFLEKRKPNYKDC